MSQNICHNHEVKDASGKRVPPLWNHVHHPEVHPHLPLLAALTVIEILADINYPGSLG